MPDNWEIEGRTLVYLLGKYSDSPNFAAWDADIIDYVLELHVSLDNGDLRRLAEALKEKKLLLLGMRFGDWLTRFFIHLFRRPPWHGDTRLTYIADHDVFAAEPFVLFIQGRPGERRFIPGDPKVFVGELYRRWAERSRLSENIKQNEPASSETGKVFVSYASEDEEAAKTLCESLKEAGCDVWFDKVELQPGEAYAKTMERRIRWDCCAFVSIISKHTEKWGGFFHQERVWARIRATYEGVIGEFYLPVIVDPELSSQDIKREPIPEHFRPNFVKLPNGIPDNNFLFRPARSRSKTVSDE